MQWHRAGLIALWEFSEEHFKQRNGQDVLLQQVENPIEKRWGVMVVIKSLQFLATAIDAALKETSQYRAGVGSVSNGNHVNSNQSNMLHIALVGINNQMSTLQDRFVCPPYPYVSILFNGKSSVVYHQQLMNVIHSFCYLMLFSL
jgi:acetyl-CoA carboxylase/biotin carboxylase 1